MSVEGKELLLVEEVCVCVCVLERSYNVILLPWLTLLEHPSSCHVTELGDLHAYTSDKP
jgi:hypothetical protein